MTRNRQRGRGKSITTLLAQSLLRKLDQGVLVVRRASTRKSLVTIPLPKALEKFRRTDT